MGAEDSVFTFMEQLINDPPLKQEIGLMARQQNPSLPRRRTGSLEKQHYNKITPESVFWNV
jgi:hypothetical protein